jgi:uncharacterized membrane protein YciS (DUF1049 family)
MVGESYHLENLVAREIGVRFSIIVVICAILVLSLMLSLMLLARKMLHRAWSVHNRSSGYSENI